MEQITPGITREWLHNRHVVVYTVQNFSVAAFIKWSQAIAEMLMQMPEGWDYLAVYDVSRTGMSLHYLGLTGYRVTDPWLTKSSERSFLELQKARPTMNTKLAVVMSAQLSGQLAMRRARAAAVEDERIDSRIFADRQTALQWISSFVAEEDRITS